MPPTLYEKLFAAPFKNRDAAPSLVLPHRNVSKRRFVISDISTTLLVNDINGRSGCVGLSPFIIDVSKTDSGGHSYASCALINLLEKYRVSIKGSQNGPKARMKKGNKK